MGVIEKRVNSLQTKGFYYFIIFYLIGLTANGQETKTTNSSMVLIPGGEYMMGKDSESGYDFSPAHKVKVDSFFMDKHEVSNGEYLQFFKETD